MFRNGTQIATQTGLTAYPPGNNSLGLGRRTVGGTAEAWKGEIGDLMIYNRALSTGEREGVEMFLARKYGLTGGFCALGFSSKYRDEDTGLVYYGYRHYSPSLGRWVSRDPIGQAGGISLYGFVGNDPVNRLDPVGLSILDYDWYNDLGDWAQSQHQQFSDSVIGSAGDGVDWVTAGALGTVSELFAGILSYPQAISQLGTGSGRFAGDPSLENLAGVAQDLSIASTVMAAGLSPLTLGNQPIKNVIKKRCPPKPAAETGASRLRLNVFGTGEAPGFIDVSSNARFANGRPLTSGFGNGSASDIFIRNSTITGENTISEIMRLSQPGTRITLMQPASGFQGQSLINAFGNNASVNFMRTFPSQTVAPGVDMTILRMTVGGH